MRLQVFRQRQQTPCRIAPLCPIGDVAVLIESFDFAQPDAFLRSVDLHYIRNVAGTQAAADRELNILEEAPAPPLGLEPFDGHFRFAAVCLAAATTQADGNLGDD